MGSYDLDPSQITFDDPAPAPKKTPVAGPAPVVAPSSPPVQGTAPQAADPAALPTTKTTLPRTPKFGELRDPSGITQATGLFEEPVVGKDLTKERDSLLQKRMQQWSQTYVAEHGAPPPHEKALEHYQEEREKATFEVARAHADTRGMATPYIDTDPDATTAGLVDWIESDVGDFTAGPAGWALLAARKMGFDAPSLKTLEEDLGAPEFVQEARFSILAPSYWAMKYVPHPGLGTSEQRLLAGYEPPDSMGEYLAPFAAAILPYHEEVSHGKYDKQGNFILEKGDTFSKQEALGWLSYFGRVVSPYTYISTAIEAGKWGSPEHLKLLRRGKEAMDYAEPLGEQINPTLPVVNALVEASGGDPETSWVTHTAKVWAGGSAILAAELLTPDGMSVGLNLLGRGIRTVANVGGEAIGMATAATRAERATRIAEAANAKLLKAVEKGVQTSEDADNVDKLIKAGLRDISNEVGKGHADVLSSMLVSGLATHGEPSYATRQLMKQAEEADGILRRSLEDLTDAATDADRADVVVNAYIAEVKKTTALQALAAETAAQRDLVRSLAPIAEDATADTLKAAQKAVAEASGDVYKAMRLYQEGDIPYAAYQAARKQLGDARASLARILGKGADDTMTTLAARADELAVNAARRKKALWDKLSPAAKESLRAVHGQAERHIRFLDSRVHRANASRRVAETAARMFQGYADSAKAMRALEDIPETTFATKDVLRALGSLDDLDAKKLSAVVENFFTDPKVAEEFAGTGSAIAAPLREVLEGGGVTDKAAFAKSLDALQTYAIDKNFARAGGPSLFRSAELEQKALRNTADPMPGFTGSGWIADVTAPMLRTMYKFGEDIYRFTKPAVRQLGDFDDEFLQIGKAMQAGVGRVQTELYRIGLSHKDTATRGQAIVDYITKTAAQQPSKGAFLGGTLVNSEGQVSMWNQFQELARRNYLNALARGLDEGAALNHVVKHTPGIKAVSRAWFRSGNDYTGVAERVERHVAGLIAKKEGDYWGFGEYLGEGDAGGFFYDVLPREVQRLTQTWTAPADFLAQEAPRATTFAAQGAASGALALRAGTRFRGKLLGFSKADAEAVMAMVTGEAVGDLATIEKAHGLLQRIGIPPKLRKLNDGVMKEISAGLNVYGNDAWLPSQWVQAMEKKLDRIIKETDAYHKTQGGAVDEAMGFFKTLISWYKTGLTSGTLLPSVRYYVNVSAGTFSQIWFEPQGGVVQAGRVVAQSAADTVTRATNGTIEAVTKWSPVKMEGLIPFLGPQIDKGVVKGIPSPLSAFYNPHIAMVFDTTKYGNDIRITGHGGREWLLGDIRRAVQEQGVLESFTKTEISELARRGKVSKPRAVGKALAAPRNLWADIADNIEQRQRVAYFTDLWINQGRTEQAAGKAVRSALYDWGFAVGEQGVDRWMTQLGLFYRFQKLYMLQGLKAFSEPFIDGFKGQQSITDAIIKSTPMFGGGYRLPRAQQQLGALKLGEQWVNPAIDPNTVDLDGDGVVGGPGDIALWQLSEVYPWYRQKSAKPMLANGPLDATDVQAYRNLFDRKFTHGTYSMPGLTSLDSLSVWTTGVSNLLALASGHTTPAMVGMDGMEYIIDSFVPALQDWMWDRRRYPSKGAILKASEIQGMSWLGQAIPIFRPYKVPGRDEEYNPWRGDELATHVRRALPLVGRELTNYLDPIVEGQALDLDTAEFIAYFFGQTTGIGRFVPHNPESTLKNSAYSRAEALDPERAKAKRVYSTPSP